MSQESVTQVIAKALAEPDFRSLLFSKPEEALQGFDLSDDEKRGLSTINPEAFEELSADLEQRISKSGIFTFHRDFLVNDSIRKIVVTYG